MPIATTMTDNNLFILLPSAAKLNAAMHVGKLSSPPLFLLWMEPQSTALMPQQPAHNSWPWHQWWWWQLSRCHHWWQSCSPQHCYHTPNRWTHQLAAAIQVNCCFYFPLFFLTSWLLLVFPHPITKNGITSHQGQELCFQENGLGCHIRCCLPR